MTVDEVTRLALAAGAGDRAAAESFIRATQADVWRMCRHLANRELAEDLTQETYLRAFRGLSGFAGRASARTWLLSIARRVVVDHHRAAACRPRTEATADLAPHPALTTGDVADGVALRGLVRGLDLDRREAFVLTQVLGLSYAEAAQICDCPVGTIRSRVARARDDLVRATVAGPDRAARQQPRSHQS